MIFVHKADGGGSGLKIYSDALVMVYCGNDRWWRGVGRQQLHMKIVRGDCDRYRGDGVACIKHLKTKRNA